MYKELSIHQKLYDAATYGNFNDVVDLVAKGADFTIDDHKPLRYASGHGHKETVEFLLSKGSSPNPLDYHSLRWALSDNYIEISKMLFDASSPKPSGHFLGVEFGYSKNFSLEMLELAKYFASNTKGFVKGLLEVKPGYSYKAWGDIDENPYLEEFINFDKALKEKVKLEKSLQNKKTSKGLVIKV